MKLRIVPVKVDHQLTTYYREVEENKWASISTSIVYLFMKLELINFILILLFLK
jgi:hypothetical protein